MEPKVSASTATARCEKAPGGTCARGLDDRVRFVEGVAPTEAVPVDLALCVGSHHAYGDQTQALEVLHRLTKPGGRVLFGATFWEAAPTRQQTPAPDIESDALTDLDGLVDLGDERGIPSTLDADGKSRRVGVF